MVVALFFVSLVVSLAGANQVALARLLIVIGFRTLKLGQVETVWKTGPVQQTVMQLTW